MKLKRLVNISKASGLILLAFSLYTNVYSQQVQPIRELNSPYDEQHPVFSPTGELFFSIGFHPENTGGPTDFGDIFMSKKDENQKWTDPVRVNDLCTSGNDVVVGFLDALTLLVYHDGNGKKQGVHQYSRFGNSWNYLRPLDMGNFKNNAGHFSGRLNPEADVMILSMTSYGSFGNEDIYVSFKKSEGVWSSPQNLGAQINTFAQELTPFLTQDLKTLYFSSNSNSEDKNRGRDIYYCHRIDDNWEKWTTPQPIKDANSVGSELSYITMGSDDGLAVFTSTQNSEGFGDLMSVNFEVFEAPEQEVLIAEDIPEEEVEPVQKADGTSAEKKLANADTINKNLKEEIVAEETKKTSEADEEEMIVEPEETDTVQAMPSFSIIKVLDFNTKEELEYRLTLRNARGLKKPIESQEELLKLLEEPARRNILVASKGYLPQDLAMQDWKNLAENDQPLLMKPALAGTSIVLENIQFNRGTSEFADVQSIQILDNLTDFLKDNPDVRIRLEGHTDNAGDPVLNKELSLNRASKIRGYLTLNGINFERVRISGWGGTRPITGNDTEEGRNLNRRVEMVIEQ